MAVKGTGIIAKPEDVARAKEWLAEFRSTPVIRVHGRWLPEDAEAIFKRRLDDLAVSYGLPTPELIDGEPNRYGLMATGEFLRWEPDETGSAASLKGEDGR